MENVEYYNYEKVNPNGEVESLPSNDFDGSVCGHIVFNLKAWMDENPETRKSLGWVKHVTPSTKDIQFNPQTQFLVKSTKYVDEFTVVDEYHVLDKSEEMIALEELLQYVENANYFGRLRFSPV